jgi:hypothetical protein
MRNLNQIDADYQAKRKAENERHEKAIATIQREYYKVRDARLARVNRKMEAKGI